MFGADFHRGFLHSKQRDPLKEKPLTLPSDTLTGISAQERNHRANRPRSRIPQDYPDPSLTNPRCLPSRQTHTNPSGCCGRAGGGGRLWRRQVTSPRLRVCGAARCHRRVSGFLGDRGSQREPHTGSFHSPNPRPCPHR